MLRQGARWVNTQTEMQEAWGVTGQDTILDWRRLYQGNLRDSLVYLDALYIGGANEVVVWDETKLGYHKAPGTGADRTRKSNQKGRSIELAVRPEGRSAKARTAHRLLAH